MQITEIPYVYTSVYCDVVIQSVLYSAVMCIFYMLSPPCMSIKLNSLSHYHGQCSSRNLLLTNNYISQFYLTYV